MKISALFLSVLLYYSSEFQILKKSWFPAPMRELIFISKYDTGDCLVHSKGHWGRKKKKVLGMKFKGEKEFYLLIDQDRREFMSLGSKSIIEQSAVKVGC